MFSFNNVFYFDFNIYIYIYTDYYACKNFDIENEINVLTMQNLAEKLTDMKNEFYQTKNEKILQQQKLAQEIEDLKNQNLNKTKTNALVVADLIKSKQEEGEKLHLEITKLELNCKKKETLFNKYLILLRNKCTKNEDESFYKMNPAIILENNFEEELKHEMIAALGKEKAFLTKEDLSKYEGTIDIYFRDLFERERTIQLILLQRTKIESNLKEHQSAINSICDKIQETENEIKLKKMRFQEVNKNLYVLKQKIESRNRTLKFNLENLSESNFIDYMNANEEVLKSMKRIYGNKILSKVFKAQKEKFFENVMLDHSFKKNKINEFLKQVIQYESNINDYEQEKEQLLQQFKDLCCELEEVKAHIALKSKEYDALKLAKSELMRKIEIMLAEEIEEITNEKIKLRQKLNSDFYFVKVKEQANKIEQLKTEKEKILGEFFHFRDVIVEREQQLYKNDLDMKKELMGMEPTGEEISKELLGSVGEKILKSPKIQEQTFTEDKVKPGDTTFPIKSDSGPFRAVDNNNEVGEIKTKENIFKEKEDNQMQSSDNEHKETNKFDAFDSPDEDQKNEFNRKEENNFLEDSQQMTLQHRQQMVETSKQKIFKF